MKTTSTVIGVVLLGALAITSVLGLFYPKATVTRVGAVATSSDQTVNNTSRMATITISPSTGTSTYILNTDSVDRVITSTEAFCTNVGTSKTYLTGAGLLQWTLQAATTTSNTVGLQGNTNYAANIVIATSSTYSFNSTTTDGFIPTVSRIWPTGTYLAFTFNATNTAACTVGSRYFTI